MPSKLVRDWQSDGEKVPPRAYPLTDLELLLEYERCLNDPTQPQGIRRLAALRAGGLYKKLKRLEPIPEPEEDVDQMVLELF
jgi:hypothetical protein